MGTVDGSLYLRAVEMVLGRIVTACNDGLAKHPGHVALGGLLTAAEALIGDLHGWVPMTDQQRAMGYRTVVLMTREVGIDLDDLTEASSAALRDADVAHLRSAFSPGEAPPPLRN